MSAATKKNTPGYFELPCYPDYKPSAGRRLVVNVADNFCGRPGSTIFIGGGGYATYPTRAQALEILPKVVCAFLERDVAALRKRLAYAERHLASWKQDRSRFARVEQRDG